ncbi:MAG: DUF1553 domain-containing protein [Verrucomicrobiales bacterium]
MGELAAILAALLAATVAEGADLPPAAPRTVDFVTDIQPIFESACVQCHGPEKQRNDYRLDAKAVAMTGGSVHGPNIIPGRGAESPLLRFVAGLDPEIKMPPKGDPLTTEQIGLLRRWIDDGATWPDSASLQLEDKADWWSLRPVVRPAIPPLPPGGRNSIDAFIGAKLAQHGISPAPEADPRTLIRRLYFNLTGLPPAPEEVEAFVHAWTAPDDREAVYGKLVDSLLASPRYGERWARHWLDVVHYGETHGYDKDQPRPNAWPYRDYVIRSFNEDKPYPRFVQEQIAGDVLFPGTVDGVTALGFIAAGPWDLIGHAEVPESKIDGKIARHLDRDDMVSNTISTFNAMTVHCAQCHDHKFDPISAEDYYGLQSVFAALDRADRPFDDNPAITGRRQELTARQRALRARLGAAEAAARGRSGETLASIDTLIASLKKPATPATQGWHSVLESSATSVKWVQLDLGATPVDIRRLVLHPCHDDFNQIGAGFGFPVRFKLEASDDPEFRTGVRVVTDQTATDFPNPGIKPVAYDVSLRVRYLRLTATVLASRKDAFMAALAEWRVEDATGANVAASAQVTSLDSIETPGRWTRDYLVDGLSPGNAADPADTARTLDHLQQARRLVIQAMLGADGFAALEADEKESAIVDKEIQSLPAPRLVYAGTIHHGGGAFVGTGATGGQPRLVTVLARGDVRHPGRPAIPGSISSIPGLTARFDLPANAPEGARRAALAEWITAPSHPLTSRTIINRVWHYHFGRGIVDTPNDFGRMGGLPTHPELLDWLALTFRDEYRGSIKQLHRLIVTSATYRQTSSVDNPAATRLDSENSLLWRQNRRKLEAEAVRDSVLAVAGKLDLTMGGPSFKDFVVERPEHSPHYQYHLADPENPALHRRSIYRFLVRSQQQPWMATLDCADPSMMVEKRNQTITPLQALAQLNNQLMVSMARHFSARVAAAGPEIAGPLTFAFRLALQRDPSAEELAGLAEYAQAHGLANACRLLINLNEFNFID